MFIRMQTVVMAVLFATAIVHPVQAERIRAKIGGGPTGGTFNTFANAMAIYVPKHLEHVKMSAVGSGGSVENVKRVSKGESDFGLCYAVDAALARNGKLPHDKRRYTGVRVLGFLYGAPAQLVVRRAGEIECARDLRGRRVAVGNAGSGAAASAERFLRHLGVWDEVKPQFLGYSAAASAFKDGKIDAFWILAGHPNRAVIEASVQIDIRLVDLGQDAEATDFFATYDYLPTIIPEGAYGAETPACSTFQDATLLVAHAELPADLVATVVEILWSEEGRAEMVAAKQIFGEMTLENGFLGATVPLHPGAERFWREQGKEIPDHLKP